MLVDESFRVKKKETLFVLDDRDYQARFNVAKATLEEAIKTADAQNATLEKSLEHLAIVKEEVPQEIAMAKAAMTSAHANLLHAQNDYKRFKTMFSRKAIGRRKLEEIDTRLKVAMGTFDAKKAKYQEALIKKRTIILAEKEVAEARMAFEAARARVERAKKEVAAARLNLLHTKIKSPLDGIVAKRFLNQGDYAAPGYPVVSLYDTRNIYVIANLEETKARHVKLEAPVDIWVDTYPGTRIKGEVVRIGAASSARFALIPRDVTAGEFTKVVQRIPIKVSIIDSKGKTLVPGMSVEVGISNN
jgi:membrane fusion protein (multidrug efflux system)